MKESSQTGHLAALFTILIWGTTYIATKVLLTEFAPVEILFFRFTLGLAALYIATRRRFSFQGIRQELTMAGAGLCGVCLYYLLENIALTYTSASNVGIIVSTVPFFTVLVGRIFRRGQPWPKLHFWLGFVVAMVGIGLIHIQGQAFHLNPKGDLLALLASLVWAFYSNFTEKIASFGHPVTLTTRRIFCYGLIFMLPAMAIFGFRLAPERFLDPGIVANFLFLGLGACALCFVTWNFAVRVLGPVKTTVYLYLSPVITMVTAAIVLNEPMTAGMILGAALTLFGLFLSQGNMLFRWLKKSKTA